MVKTHVTNVASTMSRQNLPSILVGSPVTPFKYAAFALLVQNIKFKSCSFYQTSEYMNDCKQIPKKNSHNTEH